MKKKKRPGLSPPLPQPFRVSAADDNCFQEALQSDPVSVIAPGLYLANLSHVDLRIPVDPMEKSFREDCLPLFQ